jgi:hypothetical protein
MQVDDRTFVVNSLMGWAAFLKWGFSLFEQWKYVTFTVRLGADRSLDQNALLHVWITEYAAHLAQIHTKKVTPAMIEFLKRKLKKAYYLESGFPWMVERLVDPQSSEEGGLYFRSSADYKVGEMFLFLTWFQMHAANDGCILESRGQYAKLQRQQEAA